MKKVLSILLIAVLCLTLVPSTASAAVKLNKKSATITIGETCSLRLSGNSTTVKWTSGNKDIATVSNKGIVTAVSLGNTNIVAAVNKHKYICVITVTDGYNANEAANNISANFSTVSKGVIAVLTNNNKYSLQLDATMLFYDAAGVMIDKETDENYCFTAGHKCALFFDIPRDNDGGIVAYSSYKIIYNTDSISSSLYNRVDNIKTDSNIGAENVMVTVSNAGSEKTSNAKISILFYVNGSVVGYDCDYAEIDIANSSDVLKFNFPYDDNYDTIPVTSYDIFVNSSYIYSWE